MPIILSGSTGIVTPSAKVEDLVTGKIVSTGDSGELQNSFGTISPPFNITATSGFANLEMGGPSGAYIDMKSPADSDYDARIIYQPGNSLQITTNSTSSDPILLRHGNSTKLSTSSTGITVTGALGVNSGTENVVATFTSTDTEAQINLVDTTGSAQIRSRNDLRFYTNGGSTRAMDIDASGNLGLGTTSPRSDANITTLEVSGSTFARQILQATNTGGREYGLVTGTSGSFLIHDYTEPATRLTLTSAGNLGLNTSSPTNYNSTTYKNISVDGSVGATMELHIDGALRAYFHAYGSFVGIGTKTNYAMNFVQNDTTRATIDADGNFHVGKTAVGNDAGCTLYDHGQAYFVTGAGEATLLVNNSGGSNSTNTLIQFYRNSSGVGTVTTSGSATSYNTSSDYRLKTDVQPMTGASDRVQALNPVNFEWIADGTRVDGFLAHEAATVVPEAVHGTKDAMKDEEYEISAATGEIYTPLEAAYVDEDGEEVDATDEVIHSTDVVEPETLAEGQLWRQTTEAVMGTRSVIDPQGIDQAKIVPLLTAALQEALTKIDSLETRLTALEAE